MIYLEAALVLGLLGLVVYLTIRALTVPTESGGAVRKPASVPGEWRVAHHDQDGATRIVVEKVSAAGDVVDEHLVATITVDDPAYDERFLTAMATARQRRALFESEQ